MNVFEVFTGNPFNTPVGQRIDKATDASLSSEDWALNMEICDIINETDEGPKDAIRAVRKKLTNSIGREWSSVNYCLVVLETCVKNCGKRFHIQVANKDFLQDLVKIIAPKNDPPVTVQEKVLGLIQTWADAFRGSPELRAVEALYHELKQKGIEFPATDMDHMAPIHTPKSATDSQKMSPVRPASGTQHSSQHTSQPNRTQAAVGPPNPPQTMTAAGATTQQQPARQPSGEQMSKLRSDIDIVQGNCRVFNEMLNVCTPGSSELTADTIELMKELNRTCRQMQQRIVVLIEQIADEQVTEVLLRVNDDLNNAFLRYDRLERIISLPTAKTTTQAAPESYTPSAAAAVAAPPTTESASLIDLGPSEPSVAPPMSASALSAHMDSLALHSPSNISNITDVPVSKTGDDDFDVFAQSRKYDTKAPSAAASYSYQAEAGQTSSSMGAAASGRGNPYDQEESAATSDQPSATSSEFDKFLEERAAAGEKLPDKPSSDEDNSQRPARRLRKDDSENALFAL